MRNRSFFELFLVFCSGLILLFIIAPLAGMVINTPPAQLTDTLSDKEVTRSIWLTLFSSMGATLVFALAAIPLSYFLARHQFWGRSLLIGIIDLPVVIPHTAAGIALLGFISRDSILGKSASVLGLEFVGHPIGIALAMAFVSIPFLVNAAREGFAAVPLKLEKAALNLGASPLRVFLSISLPLAWRQILSGLIMMFARGMSEFGAVVIIAYHPMITPILIYERFGAFGLRYARPVAVIFMLVSLTTFIILRLLARSRKQHDS